MGTEAKLTKAQRKALEWFSVNGEASLFGPNDPSLSMVKKLRDAGLLASRPPERGGFGGFTIFSLTDAGHAALSRSTSGGKPE